MSYPIPLSAPLGKGQDDEERRAEAKDLRDTAATETTPAGRDPVHWEVVAETMGLLPAQIIAGRLQSEGIPARAWQESIGMVHGLYIGPMGTGYVSVPDDYADQATAILEESELLDDDDYEYDDDEDDLTADDEDESTTYA
jgi:hypothetical protein